MHAVLFPRMMRVRQIFPKPAPLEIRTELEREFAQVAERVKPGSKIAVGVGSRGITNLREIVAAVIALLKQAGASPFVIPAMGSHGGATPEGQAALLAGYGVSEQTMGVPVRASLDVERIGKTTEGIDVFCSVEALRADGIVLVNRIKPHTDFSGRVGSGIAKMAVIGLGKRTGAAACHAAASRLGLERVIRSVSKVALDSAPILFGVGILENQFHSTAKLAVLKPEELYEREEELLVEARNIMPLLPFDEIDLLVVDRIGKNISGAGMDPNVTGRRVQGYSSSLAAKSDAPPTIRRIFVRDLTPETHGNAIGIGFADFTTARLVRNMDKHVTYINAMTSLTPHSAKIPIHFESDRDALEMAIPSLALSDGQAARIVRISDTLSVTELEASEAYQEEIQRRQELELISPPQAWQFNSGGNLPPV